MEARRAQKDSDEDSTKSRAPELTPDEEQKAEEERSLDANITYEVIRREGEDELSRAPAALAWSGLAAGLSMGFSLVAEGLLRAHIADAPWRPLITKLGYSVGFLIVILGSQQLFTENTLTPIVPLLAKPSGEKASKVARLWGVVLATNLIGAFLFAIVAATTTAFAPEVQRAFEDIGHDAMQHGPATTALHAVFAGWLIALMVWMLPAAESSQVWVILVITYIVGLAGFAHIIAGATEVLYVAVRGLVPFQTVVGSYMLPTLVGNVVGGVSLVAALNHAQVVAGGGKRRA